MRFVKQNMLVLQSHTQIRKKVDSMANWQKEIMTLANDFCLNMAKAKEIVLATDKLTVPQGKIEEEYKYDKAYAQIKQMIFAM